MFIIISSDTTARFHIVRYVEMYASRPHVWTHTYAYACVQADAATYTQRHKHTRAEVSVCVCEKKKGIGSTSMLFFSSLSLDGYLPLGLPSSPLSLPQFFEPRARIINPRLADFFENTPRVRRRRDRSGSLARSLRYARTTHVKVPSSVLSSIILAILPLYRGIEASRDDR